MLAFKQSIQHIRAMIRGEIGKLFQLGLTVRKQTVFSVTIRWDRIRHECTSSNAETFLHVNRILFGKWLLDEAISLTFIIFYKFVTQVICQSLENKFIDKCKTFSHFIWLGAWVAVHRTVWRKCPTSKIDRCFVVWSTDMICNLRWTVRLEGVGRFFSS